VVWEDALHKQAPNDACMGGDFETYIMAGGDETFGQLCAHDKEKGYIV